MKWLDKVNKEEGVLTKKTPIFRLRGIDWLKIKQSFALSLINQVGDVSIKAEKCITPEDIYNFALA